MANSQGANVTRSTFQGAIRPVYYYAFAVVTTVWAVTLRYYAWVFKNYVLATWGNFFFFFLGVFLYFVVVESHFINLI